MSQSRFVRSFVAALALAPGPAAVSAPGLSSPKASLRVRVPDAAGMAVKRALLSARKRLRTSRCQEVLSAFPSKDNSQSLEQVLAGLGRTAVEQLDRLTFEDGSRRAPCGSPAILAFTRPGSSTVYVCASQFRNAVRSDPAYAEMILIHELLHTLGLGENPPTSLDITAGVTERCGDAPTRRADVAP